MSSKPAVTADTLAQVLAAFNRHDLDAVMSFFADDVVMEMPRGSDPWGSRYVGQETVREGGRRALREHPRRPLLGGQARRLQGPGRFGMVVDRNHDGGRAHRRARVRPLGVPRRPDRPQGLVLEDRRLAPTACRILAAVQTARTQQPPTGALRSG